MPDGGDQEKRQAELYELEMGRKPPSPSDHPLGWQWPWRGTKEEREKLRAEVLDEPDEGPVEVHPDQEELFG